MNLATRCPSCGTVFRVGEEHLLASEGWVRCGRCDGVFNASEVLFDVDTGAPMRLAAAPPAAEAPASRATVPAAGPPPTRRPPAPREPPTAPRLALQDLPDLHELRDLPEGVLLRAPSRMADDEIDEPIVITDHVPPPKPAAAPALTVPDGAAAPAASGPASAAVGHGSVGLRLDQLVADAPAAPAGATASTAAAATAPALQAPAQATPSFLRQAERSRLWRHPAARSAGWAAVALLAVALPLQAAVLWRDTLAAHLPAAQPALQALCRLAGCQVQPLQRIHQLSVASSGLNRLEGSNAYRLQLVLQNRADTALAMPAVDLTLTDPAGQLLARRVLAGADLGVAQATLQPGQDLPIQVLLSTGDRRAAGYTVELFYP